MMAYRKRRASKVLHQKFQWFFDLQTKADEMQIIEVSAGGYGVYKRLFPFFSAFKYYKLGGVKMKFVPASTLPVDPTGLSYGAGENTVDPRDQLTPGLTRITNGEDVYTKLDGLTGDQQRELYESMMIDQRWFKWQLQSGLSRYARPMYWQIGQLHQDYLPGSVRNLADTSLTEDCQSISAVYDGANPSGPTAAPITVAADASDPRGLFQTGHRGKLGWMPTDGVLLKGTSGGSGTVHAQAVEAAIPAVNVFTIVTPPMHKTNYYYRVFVTEDVYFKSPVVVGYQNFRSIDRFVQPQFPVAKLPTVNSATTDSNKPFPTNSGEQLPGVIQ
uniref:Capsid protein n=1 Tax=Porcine associated porprismacovirus TaxID=2496634 RepID=A0A482JPY5_9VIRU|nr:capsid protein [Porcine associated porprismacovirus]QBP37154.1 capsid protein [Porcine associated porprismacovirus]